MALVIGPRCLRDAYRRLSRTMCTTHVCTVASGQVARIEEGKPFSPSQHTNRRVGEAAVSQLGRHGRPLGGAFAA